MYLHNEVVLIQMIVKSTFVQLGFKNEPLNMCCVIR
jgi:hypothetical protein